MGSTYKLLIATTLSSSASVVTLSSIPQTYDSLLLRISARQEDSAGDGALLPNGDYNISHTYAQITSGTVSSARDTTTLYGYRLYKYANENTDTASTFSNTEIYIPEYRSGTKKPHSVSRSVNSNDSNGTAGIEARLWHETSAITMLRVGTISGNISAGSKFFLYGIKG